MKITVTETVPTNNPCLCGCGRTPVAGLWMRGHYWTGRRRGARPEPTAEQIASRRATPVSLAHIDRESLAWAAGVFDGEGSTFCNRKTPPMLTVPQSGSRELLDRFRASVGGLGAIYGPRVMANPRAKVRWDWKSCSFEHAQAVMALLWPFLCSVKRRQMSDAFRKYHAWRRDTGAQEGWQIKRTCEKCGWTIQGVAYFLHRKKCLSQ